MNLFVHQAALGDFVLTFPLLRALDRLGERTMVVTHWSLAQLAAEQFDHVEPVDANLREFTRLFDHGGPAAVSPFFREAFEAAERVISFVSRGDDDWAENMRRLAPQAAHAYVFPRPPHDWTESVVAWHRRQLEQQAMPLDYDPSHNPSTRAKPGPRRDGPILVHPGSGGEEKCWPVHRFLELTDSLKADGLDVEIVLGETERERMDQPALDRLRDDYGARDDLSLLELRDRVRRAKLYVGNDSGPTHLAAQLGAPTVAIFGPTVPAVWGPVGPAVEIVAPPSPGPIDTITIDQVREAIARQLEQSAPSR